MAPQPKRQNPQTQTLTTALRKICKDYPAGAGVLRELLQNADDAGASRVRFVLDTSSHAQSPTLVDGLEQYQGPALLAYNDAVFTDSDFKSLASIGNSEKLNDRTATGKFGLGFSSVFNWTDCPSILSRSTLLILDPHYSWSAVFRPPGGPEYDFPSCADDPAMEAQLESFSTINDSWDAPFEGTIVRVPLRTSEQASKSDISKMETSIKDIEFALKSFARELGSNGLLFLKSVRHIMMSTDDDAICEVEIEDVRDLEMARQQIKSLLLRTSLHTNNGIRESYHEARIRLREADAETTKVFGVYHSFGATMSDNKLERWALAEKLFPWVAVAVELDKDSATADPGRLFTVLPLPLLSHQPVHVHALFAISPDRSRLLGEDNRGVQDQRPKEWNDFIFKILVPRAWSRLSAYLSSRYPDTDRSILPAPEENSGVWWSGLLNNLINCIESQKLPVWFTSEGHVELQQGLVSSLNQTSALANCLSEACVPVIYLPQHILGCLRKKATVRWLSPETTLSFLKPENIQSMPRQARIELLNYLLSDVSIDRIKHLEIWPFEDMKFRSLQAGAAFLHRNQLEKQLFCHELEVNLDTEGIAGPVLSQLHLNAVPKKSPTPITYRWPAALKPYFFKHVSQSQSDFIVASDSQRKTIEQATAWLRQFTAGPVLNSDIHDLWLVATTGSEFRKVLPTKAGGACVFVSTDHTAEALNTLGSLATNKINRTVRVQEDFFRDHISWLTQYEPFGQKFALKIFDGESLSGFINFLCSSTPNMLENADESARRTILSTIQRLCTSNSSLVDPSLCARLKTLPLFEQAYWNSNTTAIKGARQWISLASNIAYIGSKDPVPYPLGLFGPIIVDLADEKISSFLSRTGLLSAIPEHTFIENHVVLALKSGSYKHLNKACTEEASRRILRNFYQISPKARDGLANIPFIPVQSKSECTPDPILHFRSPVDLVDPQRSEIIELFSSEETVVPRSDFLEEFSGVLQHLGMMSKVTERLLRERIIAYSTKTAGKLQLLKVLLTQPIDGSCITTSLIQESRNRDWLIATWPGKEIDRLYAQECRDERSRYVVSYVLPTLPFQVHESWLKVLGWDERLQLSTCIAQLRKCIENGDTMRLKLALDYLSKSYCITDFLDSLSELDWIVARNDTFIATTTACKRGCAKLAPLLNEVDPKFWSRYERIIKSMGVPETPSLAQLTHALRSLESEDEANIDLSLEIAKVWHEFFPEQQDGIKLPDEKGCLQPLKELVFNDNPFITSETRPLAHPKLSRGLAIDLGMEHISELAIKGELGILDADDDDFEQREETKDGIRDTLERYTQDSTFNEYVANADDCGTASEVDFLLDETEHPEERLLDPALASLQGPALLIHNDGVFTDADFEGFKHVGRGSKRDNQLTIGKFGRGNQTMYHFTDTPFLLSGKYLVILDPLRTCLPYNHVRKERKAGIKIELERIARKCPDQLAPFEGLWGFDNTQTYYNGTIFRFHLRKTATSELLESVKPPTEETIKAMIPQWFKKARLSLIFLRRIESISFKVRSDNDNEWKVSRGTKWPEDDDLSGLAQISGTMSMKEQPTFTTDELWFRTMEDFDESQIPIELPLHHKRRMKYIETGIAGLLNKPADSKTKRTENDLKPMLFSTLPLPFESRLPVHVNASFLTTGDRQSITVESSAAETGAAWNRWLLEEQIPSTYMTFLEDLIKIKGKDVWDFYPSISIDRTTDSVLAELIYKAFWTSLEKSNRRIFPVVEETLSVQDEIKQKKIQRPLRRAKPTVDFRNAVLDTLERELSDRLRPMLLKIGKSIVRPPRVLAAGFKNSPNIARITPSLIREALRSEDAIEALHTSIKSHPSTLNYVMSFISPKTDKDFEELEGCQIIPLVGGSLARLLNSETTSPRYFLSDRETQELFHFGQNRFVALPASKKPSSNLVVELKIMTDDVGDFFKKLLDSGLFNLDKFEKADVPKVLVDKTFWQPDKETVLWLQKFWIYMNKQTTVARQGEGSAETSSITEEDNWEQLLKHVQNFKVLVVNDCSDFAMPTKLLSPLEFERDCTVVFNAKYKSIYDNFPGLQILDTRTTPMAYQDLKGELCDSKPLEKFLLAIDELARRNQKSLTDHVRFRLRSDSAHALRTEIEKGFGYRENSKPPPLTLELPIWEPVNNGPILLSAKEALQAENVEFVTPMIPSYSRFATGIPQALVQPISIIDMLTRHILPSLPVLLEETAKPSYLQLIKAIYNNCMNAGWQKEYLNILKPSRIAVGEDGRFWTPNQLYDHDDSLFMASFSNRDVPKPFLMPEVQQYRDMWLSLGLQQRHGSAQFKQITGNQYIPCLRAYEEKLMQLLNSGTGTVSFANTARAVLEPLTSAASMLTDVNSAQRSEMNALKLFIAIGDFRNEPAYRVQRMRYLAPQNQLKSLNTVIRSSLKAICWSQTSFVRNEPHSTHLELCSSKGRPTLEMVWKHLLWLSDCAQIVRQPEIPKFLDDLLRTYTYLNGNILASAQAFRVVGPKAAVWLNIDELDFSKISEDTLRTSWVSSSNLLLYNAYDTATRQTARTFLLQFAGLLKEVGCRPVYFPEVRPPAATTTSSSQNTLGSSMWALQQEKMFTDVEFEAEGETVSAHRIVLAVNSDKFNKQFCGPWKDNFDSSEPIPIEDMNLQTLKIIIKYCYMPQHPWYAQFKTSEQDPNETIIAHLYSFLDVLEGADYFQISALYQEAETQLLKAARVLVRLDTVGTVREAATKVSASRLLAYCQDFISKNEAVVELEKTEELANGDA